MIIRLPDINTCTATKSERFAIIKQIAGNDTIILNAGIEAGPNVIGAINLTDWRDCDNAMLIDTCHFDGNGLGMRFYNHLG